MHKAFLYTWVEYVYEETERIYAPEPILIIKHKVNDN